MRNYITFYWDLEHKPGIKEGDLKVKEELLP